MSGESIERRTVFYTGQVQGVGFRYTAQRLAGSYPVTGYVQNLPNGEVEVVVEGTTAALDRYLGSIGKQMAGYIDSCRVESTRATGEFDGFGIKYPRRD
ncbi:MAG: acylphosphatase [Planctomycetota bacterium]